MAALYQTKSLARVSIAALTIIHLLCCDSDWNRDSLHKVSRFQKIGADVQKSPLHNTCFPHFRSETFLKILGQLFHFRSVSLCEGSHSVEVCMLRLLLHRPRQFAQSSVTNKHWVKMAPTKTLSDVCNNRWSFLLPVSMTTQWHARRLEKREGDKPCLFSVLECLLCY